MTVKFSAHILGWSFAPLDVLPSADRSSDVAALSPEGMNIDFVPAALRRRCSNFSKVTLAVAYAAMRGASAGSHPHTVFASMHGESLITRDLLRDLAGSQQLSPMGFSLSVHNAASGLYSIATGNIAPSTAIAAGEDTFFMGLGEALLALRVGGAEAVLLVCSDDAVPSDFVGEGVGQSRPYAFAILLARSGGVALSVEQSAEKKEARTTEPYMHQVARVARWMRDGEGELSIVSNGARWSLSIPRGGAQEFFMSAYR